VISFREFKFEIESLVYFIILEVWEKVPITKVAPDCIFYLQECFRILKTFLAIFHVLRIGFRI
jgi:hypothetical protein